MKIVFMGTPSFAAYSLKKVIDEGYEIPLVVTQPDRRGNRNKMILSPVKEMALEHGLEVAQPHRIKDDAEFVSGLKEIAPDMIVVAAFGQILPKEVLDIPRLGCVNVHGSLLPKLRGASPMQSAILEGLDETGVTIMRMDEGLDTGDMISKVKVDIRGKDIIEVADLLAEAGADLLAMTIPQIENGSAAYTSQNEEEATYSHLIKKSDGYTDFNESAVQIERKIRAYADWPSCYTYIDGGLQLKLYKAEAIPGEASAYAPGTVSAVDKHDYTISCQEGSLKVLEQQLQGKKRMGAGDFMRGHKLTPGDRFCAEEDK
ncbi:MAG: methionyl-tRNA formyltransferase [Mogibacterium sp.]|nr:methionyl-tRNA formyltransferase [Mogibacterium sp.]